MSGVVLPFSSVQPSQSSKSHRGFISFKCSEPLPYTRRCSRDALIQATLDPDISLIAPFDGAAETPGDAFFSFSVVTRGARCLITLAEQTSAAFPAPAGYDVAVAIDRESILSDPARTAARTVWSRRDCLVPPLFSVKVMRKLRASEGGVRLGDLEEDLVHEPKHWVDYTMAMACAGTIVIECGSPITDDTLVRSSQMPQRFDQRHWLGKS